MKYVVYSDFTGEWRFKIVARNGKNIAASGESFKNKAHALRICRSILNTKKAKIVVE